MNVVCYERVLLWTGLLWTWSVMNMVCYERGLLWRGLLWTWSVMNGSVMNVVCYEHGLLWTWSAMKRSVMNVVCYECGLFRVVCYEWPVMSRSLLSGHLKGLFCSGSEVQRRQPKESRRTCCDGLDLCKDENRPSSTSSAAAEERQDVWSKNTIDEMADAITGGNDIGLWAFWPAKIPGKCGNIG